MTPWREMICEIDPLISQGPWAEIICIKGLNEGSHWGSRVDSPHWNRQYRWLADCSVGLKTHRLADEPSVHSISLLGYQTLNVGMIC